MSFATGEVVSTPGEASPYKVVFKSNGNVLSEWSVASIAEGEKQIVEVLKGMNDMARREGYLK